MPQPEPIDRLLAQGLAAHRAGRIGEAETCYRAMLAQQPLHFDARHLLGVALRAKGRPSEAAAEISLALAIHPGSAEAYSNLANAHSDLGDLASAQLCLSHALRIRPAYFEASLTMAQFAWLKGDLPSAAEHFTKAAAAAPSTEWHLNCRGRAACAQGDFAAAASDLGYAAMANPALPGVQANWGEALEAGSRLPEALAAYRQGVERRSSPQSCLEGIGRILRLTFQREEAVKAFRSALCFSPASLGAALHLAATLFDLRRLGEARRWFSLAQTIAPEDGAGFLGLYNTALYSCDWGGWEPMRDKALARMRAGPSSFAPFSLLATCDDAADQLLAARAYSAHLYREPRPPLWQAGTGYRHERLRVGYLSADLHTHATAYLIAELIEVHDRRHFEIAAFSYGPDDGSPMRRRLVGAFDRFHDVQFRSDREIAELIRKEEIDILIDLKGYTQCARAGILAYRPAPAQVNYLGFPGTLGSPFHDYVIADEIVIPAGEERFYRERVIRLPGSYQVNDGRRAIASTAPTRQAEGLPEQAFVFCCFNNNWKIGRDIFALWMGLLRDVPESVLWLIHDNDTAEANLRKAAQQQGVDPARLVFSDRVPLPEHLARHRLADLFLDTLPYAAHTTASDAIFAGLPLLTCLGQSFAGRVSASLLTAIGAPDLIATTLEEYRATARMLATEPDRLREAREKLVSAPGRQALFDAKAFAVGYERALLAIATS